MAAAIKVSAVEVAREFVATKMAVVQVFEQLSGTAPALRDQAAHAVNKWTNESPVPLGGDIEAVWERANEIAEQIMRAVGNYFIECA